MSEAYELELRDITKRFGDTLANDHVSFCVRRGEVHALIGENGAGKSTLMNILYGMLRPDAGEILWRNQPLSLRSPRDAIAKGIGMVHQHFMLAPSLTVAENIALGHPPVKGPFWKPKELRRRVELLQNDYGVELPLDAPVRDLTVGLMQRVEIVKTLYRGAEVLILDEPTAVLTPQESFELFATIRRLTAAGRTVIFISHKLREVLDISDRITVLRAGKTIGTVDKAQVTAAQLAQMMIGRPLAGLGRGEPKTGEAALEVDNLCVAGDLGTTAVDAVSFSVRAGEILGVAGVEGNGQTELTEAIIGVRRPLSGHIRLLGERADGRPVDKRLNAGLAIIPQDRVREGLALNFSITDNLILHMRGAPPISHHGVIDWKAAGRVGAEMVRGYAIKAPSADELCGNLSGGNMQKVVVARELSKKPKVVIACQPTRGVDIGASEYIRKMLLKMRDEGSAVLLVSADLDEIMELSDRIMVMYGGKKSGELASGQANEQILGRMMFGETVRESAGDAV